MRLSPLALALAVAWPAALLSGADGPPGLVIEKLEPGRAGARAGLRPGDILTGWTRSSGVDAPAGGRLATPWDLAEAEDTQTPLGPVTLHGERGGQPLHALLDAGEIGLTTRTAMTAPVLAEYGRCRAAPRPEQAPALRRAAQAARQEGATRTAFWLLLEAARAAALATQREPALEALEQAAALEGDDPGWRIEELQARSRVLYLLGDAQPAREALQQALALRQEEWGPDGLSAAAGLEAIGALAWERADVPAAGPAHFEALRIREARAPGTLAHARSLRWAGAVTWARSNLDEAESLQRRTLAIVTAREPQGLTAGMATLNLGNIALGRGHHEEAATLYRAVLEMREGAAPFTFAVCAAHANLGLIALEQRDLQTAEKDYDGANRCYGQNLSAEQELMDRVAWRGNIATERGDYAAARQAYAQWLEIAQRRSLNVSFALQSLGDVALLAGDLDEARRYLEGALTEYEQRYGRESVWYANNLSGLAELAIRQGRAEEARTLLEQALAIHKKADHDGVDMARCLRALGLAAEAEHEPARARQHYEAALALVERLSPGTYSEAEVLHDLGRLRWAQGADPEGARLLRRAVTVLEASMPQVGGGQEGLSIFRARHADIYRDLMLAELQMGRADEALHVVESSRGRVLLDWLARRRVAVREEVPPEMRREAEDIDAAQGRIVGQLRALPASGAAESDRLVARLRELRQERAQWEARLRERVPHYAALQYPVALDAAGARQALDPGSVLLSYVVGPDATHLFVVGSGQAATKVYTLGAGSESLQRRVTAFRMGIRTPVPAEARALRRQARALYDLLLAPAEAEIESASRVLISADGALHLLPFGALARKQGYVVEWRPLHFVNSATLYAELRRGPRPAGPARLLAFGDPQPDARYSGRLGTLPGSRREVQAIERRFPGRTMAYLGRSASEGQARQAGGALAVLHFATHAVVDEHLPLDSALLLSPGPGKEDGLLQAWEVFDGVRVEADLVTLSGCETALGREMGGEGLMGLTRAFFYAGARSVLASLWRVSDRSTPELMERFYRHLARGASKDEALRAAQVEMIRAGGTRAQPFRWAAFELFGDWK